MLVRRDNKNRHLTDLFYEQMLHVIKTHAETRRWKFKPSHYPTVALKPRVAIDI